MRIAGYDGARPDSAAPHRPWRRWVRRAAAATAAATVAADAGYASYDHQWRFALEHGSRTVTAALWPLSVDGLLVLATVALLDPTYRYARRWVRWMARLAFGLGVCVSLVANIAAAGSLDWQAVLVAGWPPVALLLAVELLAHTVTAPAGETNTREQPGAPEVAEGSETTATLPRDIEGQPAGKSTVAIVSGSGEARRRRRPGGAEQRMWEHYQLVRAGGDEPTGAELDRVAGTHDYGRAVLARWRRTGRIPRHPSPSATAAGAPPSVTPGSIVTGTEVSGSGTAASENGTAVSGSGAGSGNDRSDSESASVTRLGALAAEHTERSERREHAESDSGPLTAESGRAAA